ncbi:MAG: hypothetical protein QNJ17_13080 [Desulfocapsaceae bacterium]|nr:hypothetical protein [Desulfocapsaceae bacterium]
MRMFSRLFLIIGIILTTTTLYAGTPSEIAGIKLGSKVNDYPDFEVSNYLKETVVMDWHGFRKGIIFYGICHDPGTIVKIQMKYEDPSKEFFNTLLKRYKKKYGPPTEWDGDSFGIKHIWKWRFTDEKGRRVNMLLQHNLRDADQNIGNQVKISYPEMMEKENLCFIKMCQDIEDPEKIKRREVLKKTGWEYLIPQ